MDNQNQPTTRMEPKLAFQQAVPEHAGMDERILNEIRTFALQKGGAGCVLRGGKTVLHWGDQKEIFDIFSSTKSIGVTVG